MQIRQALVDIQYGRADDTFGWMHRRSESLEPGTAVRSARRCGTLMIMQPAVIIIS